MYCLCNQSAYMGSKGLNERERERVKLKKGFEIPFLLSNLFPYYIAKVFLWIIQNWKVYLKQDWEKLKNADLGTESSNIVLFSLFGEYLGGHGGCGGAKHPYPYWWGGPYGAYDGCGRWEHGLKHPGDRDSCFTQLFPPRIKKKKIVKKLDRKVEEFRKLYELSDWL